MAISPQFHRMALMLGDEGMSALHSAEVAVFGVGGVGSWCAETLVRSGIGKLTLVDSDTVCITNVNRQLQATTRNLGRSKVLELAARLRDIHPKAGIEPIHSVYEAANREEFRLTRFDYVVDCIDSLSHKVDLIASASEAGCQVVSSMGAGNKMDPSLIRTGSIWDTTVCPLAKLVRKKLRERNFSGDIQCVYSVEPPRAIRHTSARDGSHHCFCSDEVRPGPGSDDSACAAEKKDWCDSKHEINASMAHITAIFGHWLAALVINGILERSGCVPSGRTNDSGKTAASP